MRRRAGWRPEDDPEYMAEMERAMRSTSWGCVVFCVGMALTLIALFILMSGFFSFRGPLK